MNTAQARAEVIANLAEARADYADALERCAGVIRGENWVVRIGGFYARLETDRFSRVVSTHAAGLIGCSVLTKRDADEIASVIRNGNPDDRGETVPYPEALRQEIAGLDKLIALIESKAEAATV